MKEIWKRLIYHGEDYGDWYEVSNIGNIRNARTHRVRKINVLPKGYAFVGEKVVTECEFMAQIIKNK